MQESLSTQYKKLFHEELLPYGFKLYKKTFYRIIHDVVQTVMLTKTSTNFSVDFDIIPLSLPIKDLYCEGYDISVLEKHGSWDCWPAVEEGAIEDIRLLFRRYVKPLFEQGTDSKSAYDELIRLEKMIYTGVPGGVIMNNYSFVLMCIKSNDYENAYRHMAAIVKQNIGNTAFSTFCSGREEAHNLLVEKFSPNVQALIKKMQKLSVPDIEYFQRIIAQNEAISLEYLKQPRYPGKFK